MKSFYEIIMSKRLYNFYKCKNRLEMPTWIYIHIDKQSSIDHQTNSYNLYFDQENKNGKRTGRKITRNDAI